jgi:hypothetical protein
MITSNSAGYNHLSHAVDLDGASTSSSQVERDVISACTSSFSSKGNGSAGAAQRSANVVAGVGVGAVAAEGLGVGAVAQAYGICCIKV